MSGIRLAAVVVAYNGGQKLVSCLDSLLAQTVRELEIIVVDNASTDDSVSLVEATFGDRVQVIRRATNGGYGAGANSGWRSTTADQVVILNQDLIFAPDCLEQMQRALADAPDEVLVCPKLVLAGNEQVVNTIGNEVHLSGVAWCRGLGTASNDWQGTIEVPAVSGAAILARRAFLESLGGLEESYFMYYEDVDLSVRARLAGARCVAACDAVAAHDWALAMTPWKFRLLERNRRAFWQRLSGRSHRLTPTLWQAEAMGWAFAVLRGPQYVRAKWSGTRSPLSLAALAPASHERPGLARLQARLSSNHPYHVMFPGGTGVAFVGGMVDRLATAFA
jgi:GT2 family glycosyltransferase